MTIVRVNKRTLLGGQYWLVGLAVAPTVEGIPLAGGLAAVGAYLVLGHSLGARPSKFLLWAK